MKIKLRLNVFFIDLFKIILSIVIVIIPLWVMLVNSFKTSREATLMQITLPTTWKIIENYKEVIFEGRFVKGLINTSIVTIISVSIIIIISSMAAWIFARSKKKFINILYFLSIVGILIPPATITTIFVFKWVHLYGNLITLIIFYCSYFNAIALFFITGFIKTIPIELEEAARLDGCSPFGIFFRIIFPLLSPILFTTIIFVSLFIWNDFIYPFYLIKSSSSMTLVLGLYNILGKFYGIVKWELIFADVVVVSIPLIIIYFIFQKRIVSGILSGSIKG